ncbi:MAG: hypothetical protein AAF596_06375 [Planctomycetota bacterium]
MLKKIVVTSVSLALVSGFLFGTDAGSYLSTACRQVTGSVKDSVPVEFQIERAREMVDNLSPEIKRSMHVIAKEEIAVDNLNSQINKNEAKAEKSQRDILRLQSDLTSGKNVFRYAGHSYSRDEVQSDLSRRFSRHQVADETLDHLRQMRDARAKNLDAARQKLTAMISAQKKLETDIANLEAKRRLVEVAQASSDVVLDDSQLARTKQLITDIRSRLDVAAKLAHADTSYQSEIPLDEADSEHVTDRVAAYFGLSGGGDAGVDVEVKVASIKID